MTQSDPNRILRLLPIVGGSLGAVLLLINRWFTVELTNSQSRSDVLGVILSAFLILVGLIWQQIQAIPPKTVILEGEEGFELASDLPEQIKIELAWASHLLLTNTVTRTVLVYYQDRVLLRRGILKKNIHFQLGNITKRVLETQKPVYLVDLNLYPGKVEFDYFPDNIQGLICQPLGGKGVLILAANSPRSYTKQDEAWISGIADKLTQSLLYSD
jgi:hypothetical protein